MSHFQFGLVELALFIGAALLSWRPLRRALRPIPIETTELNIQQGHKHVINE